MNPVISTLIEKDVITFEYDVHDMTRAIKWYQDVFGFEIIYGPFECHTEFALPVDGVRLALSHVNEATTIRKGPRLFLSTCDVRAVEKYMQEKGVKTKPVEKTDNVVLILWLEDSEGNSLAVEQWL